MDFHKRIISVASNTNEASINIKPGSAPSSPVNGDVWSTSSSLFARINSATYDLLASSGLTYLYKTTTYTANTNEYILANTSSAAFTITLPATPSSGTSVIIADYTGSFALYNLTVARNGSTIQGASTDAVLKDSAATYLFVYLNSTWEVYTQYSSKYSAVAAPNLTHAASANELTITTVTILNYNPDATYTMAVSGGSYTRTANNIYWTLPSVGSNTSHTMQVTSTLSGSSSSTTITTLVQNVTDVGDTTISINAFGTNSYNSGWFI